MPRRTDINSILIIGAGPIVIGQACEFDYSGAQACKALRAEGYRVILVNSNPATIMTDPGLADATYIEPITPDLVEKIIIREKPDAILPTMGGQTALNIAMKLHAAGTLAKHGVELIGAKAEVIDRGGGPAEVSGLHVRHRHRRAALGHRPLARRSPCRRGRYRPARRHPPLLHPGRHRRRHRLQPRGVRSHRRLRAGRLPHHRGADRGEHRRLEGVRGWRSCATAPTTASSSARSRTWTRWASTPGTA